MSLCLVGSNIEDLLELHFGVVGGHFLLMSQPGRFWMQVIGGQHFT